MVRLNGKGDSVRDYMFIEDAVNWLERLIFYSQKNKIEVFNLCSGRGYSVKELVNSAEKLSGRKAETSAGPAVKEKKTIIGDNKKIVKLSGRKLKYNLIQGLKKTYKNYSAVKSNS